MRRQFPRKRRAGLSQLQSRAGNGPPTTFGLRVRSQTRQKQAISAEDSQAYAADWARATTSALRRPLFGAVSQLSILPQPFSLNAGESART
jgi:hypothetical protein